MTRSILGGGTPSTYPTELLLDMFAILREKFDFSGNPEVTLEVNPGTVNREKLAAWREIGVNRLSIGVQSLKEKVLIDLNRHQLASDVQAMLLWVGDFFTNVSVDIILGLPYVSDQEWQEFLRELVTWPIQHVSMYLLEIHEGTALHVRVRKNEVVLPHDEELAKLYEWSVSFLADQGFHRYEVSSFTRDGYESRHNTVYWDYKPYKGFGIGACSFDGDCRFQNCSDLGAYIAAGKVSSQECWRGDYSKEFLSNEQKINEKIMLGVRRRAGFSLDELCDAMTPGQWLKMREVLRHLKEGGLVVEQDGRILLTPRGMLVENSVATQLSV